MYYVNHWHGLCDSLHELSLIMKKTTSLILLALSIAASAFAAFLFGGEAYATEIIFGIYAIAGLFYLTVADYSPRRTFEPTRFMPKSRANWTRRSLSRANRPTRIFRAEKISA